MTDHATESDDALLAELGDRLARRRLDRNWTQEQLATEAGVSPSTVGRLEAGQSTQLANLVRVLRALDLLGDLDVLLRPAEPSPLAQLRAQGRPPRKRASPRTDSEPPGAAPPAADWSWDDPDATPPGDDRGGTP